MDQYLFRRTVPQATFYTDGGCSGQKQLDVSKRHIISVVSDDKGNILKEEEKDGGSNNIAELWAVLLVLEHAKENKLKHIKVITDSMNNLAWASNSNKVGRGINDRDAVLFLKEKIRKLRHVIEMDLVWRPREENLAGHYIEAKYKL